MILVYLLYIGMYVLGMGLIPYIVREVGHHGSVFVMVIFLLMVVLVCNTHIQVVHTLFVPCTIQLIIKEITLETA